MTTLKLVRDWKDQDPVDEPDFGDGDGGDEVGRMYCGGCGSRAFAILTDGSVECFNCDEPIALAVKEEE